MIRWNVYQVHREVEELKGLIEETRPAMERLEVKIEQIKRFPHIPQYVVDPLNSFKYEIGNFYRRMRSSIERIEKNFPKDELERQKKRYEFYQGIYGDEAKVNEFGIEIKLPQQQEKEGQANFFGEVIPVKRKAKDEYKGEVAEIEAEIEQAEFELWERIGGISCPKCGECEVIAVEPSGYYCSMCEAEIDEDWLMSQIPQELREKLNRLYREEEDYDSTDVS